MNLRLRRIALGLCLVVTVVLFGAGRKSSRAAVESPEEQLIRTDPLGPMLGRRVLVVGRGMQQSFEQHGQIEARDAQWLRIRTTDGQVLSYSIANLLFVKLDEPAKP